MTFPRASGILLHPTSLPSPFGAGDLGDEAYAFADFLVARKYLHTSGEDTHWERLRDLTETYGRTPKHEVGSIRLDQDKE